MKRSARATTRVVAALLLLVTAVLPNALAIAAAGCSRVSQSGHWTTYDVPEFASGGPITDYAIDAFLPETMYATDGKDVLHTANGGCSWKKVFSVADATPVNYGFRGEAATIASIDVPRNTGTRGRVLLLIEEQAQGVTRPHVLRSNDAGGEWAATAGLPPAGDPEELVISPSNPDIGYLGIDLGGGGLDLLFATADGGSTWALRSDLTKGSTRDGTDHLEIDPLVPTDLWAFGTGGLFRSQDGGVSFAGVDEFQSGSQVSEVLVFHSPSRDWPIVFAFRSSDDDMRSSTDNGQSWPRSKKTAGDVESGAYGRTPNELLVSVGGRVYFFDHPTNSFAEIRTPRPGIVDLVADLGLEQDFYGRTPGTIERYDGPVTRFAPPGDVAGPQFEVPDLIEPEAIEPPAPPVLSPGGETLKMKTGAKRTVDYRLKLSAKDTPLDVFFLIDTSDTMSGTIQGLIDSVAGIMRQLNASGLDTNFGIGVSRAYTDTAVPRQECESESDTNCERNFIYRRMVDLADFSNAEQLRQALASLRAEAGGRFDSQLGALWAIATGEKIDDVPEGTMEPSDVPEGQEATFRKDALNLVFVATDEPFATGEEGARDFTISDFGRIVPPDIPSFEEVGAAMRAVDAQVLGLAIGQTLKTDRDSVNEGGPNPLEDMQRIAEETQAFAPEGGVDCDGDGVAELTEGMPLVCPVRRHNVDQGENLAAAITKLVEAVRGYTEVELEVVRGKDVVAKVTPSVYPAVVEQKPNVLDFEVTYECPDRLQGKIVTVELAATRPERTLDSVVTKVSCLEEKVDEPELPLDPVITLGVVLPPLMPPGPPPIAANAPSAQGQAQSQSQAQAQGAMAHQEQEQPQLAYVGATLDHRQALQEELAMSDRRKRSEVPQWATLGTGAAMMSLAYGWLTFSRQRSVRVQRVRR